MSYAAEQKKLIRRKIDLIILKMDYCSNTYGVAPCTATDSVKCYNTFFTCKDKQNYTKTTKQYKFITEKLPQSVKTTYYPARPYIKNISSLSTEIKEKDTVVKRLKAELYDETDNTDVGIDPYRDSRAKINGSFWKKFLARNPNYKGRIIEVYEGFEGLDEADFQMTFAGSIENISLNNNVVTIEAVDLLKKLSEIEYPLKTDIQLAEDVPMQFEAMTDSEMTSLYAFKNDICLRKDFGTFTNPAGGVTNNASGTLLANTTYWYVVIARDSYNRALGKQLFKLTTGATDNTVRIGWDTFSGADHYDIYGRTDTRKGFLWSVNTLAGSGWTTDYGWEDYGLVSPSESNLEPLHAEKYYELTDHDPSVLGDWNFLTTEIQFDVTDGTDLSGSGYIKVDDEIIGYTKSGDTLFGLERGAFGSKIDRHLQNTIVHAMFKKSSDNPFTHLKSILSLAGIDSAYIGSKFTTYESAWSGIDFSTNAIIKETKLNKIYFDLVNAVDCISWVGEDGKITIQYHDEIPAAYKKVTRETNFLEGSVSVDLNQESRKTRWIQYWNRFDVEEGIEEKKAYNRIEILIDADAEAANEYNDKIEDVQYTTWLNTDSDVVSSITTYLTDLLQKRQARTRNAQEIIEGELEIKDNDILVGEVVLISTDKLQDIYGNNYHNVAFRLVKKTPEWNKIKVKFKRVFAAEGYLLQATGDKILQGDGSLIEIQAF